MSIKLEATLEDAFAVGKLEGERECINEVLEYLKEGVNSSALKTILNAKLKVLSMKITNNPFGVTKSDGERSKP